MRPIPSVPEVIAAARRELIEPGVTVEEAVLIGFSALMGDRLDPCADSAIIERAGRLRDEGLALSRAIATARAERITWAVEA